MVGYHEELLRALLSQLNFTQATIRKKTVSCIGNMAYSFEYRIATSFWIMVFEAFYRMRH